MRRVLRWAFNLFAVMSAVLCVGDLALWSCTESVRYSLYAELPARSNGKTVTRRGVAAASSHGRLCVELGHRVYRDPLLVSEVPALADQRRLHFIRATVYEEEIPRPRLLDRHRPFQAYHEWTGYTLLPWSARGIVLPHAFLAFVFAILPAYRIGRLFARRRALGRSNAGLCPVCGYDLRATPTRCPECGTVAAPPLLNGPRSSRRWDAGIPVRRTRRDRLEQRF